MSQHESQPFKWDELITDLSAKPFVMLVEGMPGAGKTHLAMTFPEPIFLLDSENRADVVAVKFVLNENKTIYRKRVSCFNDIRQAVTEGVVPHHGSGTIVIDSASDLQKFAEAEYLVEARKSKVYPTVLWAEVFAKIDSLISFIRDKGYYVVLTARLKDEYSGEGDNRIRTGAFALDGYKRLPYLADIHLRLTGGGNANVLKNGFRGTACERTEPLTGVSFLSIQQIMREGVTDSAQVIGDRIVGMQVADRRATIQEVKSIYTAGVQLGLSDEQMKSALKRSVGKDSTNGLRVDELMAWREAMMLYTQMNDAH